MIESFTAKEEDGLTSFLFWIFQKRRSSDITFWKGTMSEEMSIYIHCQHTEM